MKSYKFTGTIQVINGKKKFVPDHDKLWLHRLSQCKEGGKAEVHFRECKITRSLKANALYWVFLQVIAESTGNEEEELHAFFKRKFLPIKEKVLFGEKVYRLSSTTELSTDEFSDFMQKISSLVEIPIPDTKSYLKEIDKADLL